MSEEVFFSFMGHTSYVLRKSYLPWILEDILWFIFKVLLFHFSHLGLKSSWNSFLYILYHRDKISSCPYADYLSICYWIPIFSLLICNDISSICQVPIYNTGLFLGSLWWCIILRISVLIVQFLLLYFHYIYYISFSSLTPMEV